MSILIKGMEMPTEHPLWIVVHADGTVEANEISQSRPVGWQTLRNAAIPVPPHGRLIDADAFKKKNAYYWGRDFIGAKYEDCLCDLVNASPTIIPAEEEET